MLPTLREERRQTYSPILPVSPSSGRVLQVPVEVVDAEAGTIAFEDEEGRVEQSALGGQAKLQWKVDWAARWVALGVDYEMSGKDLIDSVVQSSKIARVLGGRPPEGFNYEMFLDEKGEKISKSKGNGLSLEEWLRYGSEPSLAFYIYREPKKAKSLHLGLIPRAVDEYWPGDDLPGGLVHVVRAVLDEHRVEVGDVDLGARGLARVVEAREELAHGALHERRDGLDVGGDREALGREVGVAGHRLNDAWRGLDALPVANAAAPAAKGDGRCAADVPVATRCRSGSSRRCTPLPRPHRRPRRSAVRCPRSPGRRRIRWLR